MLLVSSRTLVVSVQSCGKLVSFTFFISSKEIHFKTHLLRLVFYHCYAKYVVNECLKWQYLGKKPCSLLLLLVVVNRCVKILGYFSITVTVYKSRSQNIVSRTIGKKTTQVYKTCWWMVCVWGYSSFVSSIIFF